MSDPAADFNRQVAAMLQPSTYPIRVRRIRGVPTHMAVVFLTEHHAWKLRRPARHDEIDFHSRSARLEAARNEWALDAHFAPGVCLGLASLQAIADRWMLSRPRPNPAIDCAGLPGEPVVCMHRLPTRGFMDQLIRSGGLQPAQIDRLMHRFVRLHRQRPRSAMSIDCALAQAAARHARVLAALRLPEHGQSPTLLDLIDDRLRASCDRHAAAIAARIRAGCLRDGHGDLRPEHVVLEGVRAEASGPLFIDGLEFAVELRQRDVAEELAGLAVECEFLGGETVSDRLRARWLDIDPGRRSGLWSHHAAVRALNRALHSAWHLSPQPLGDARGASTEPAAAPLVDHLRPVRDWRARARQWLLLARDHLQRALA